MAGGVFLTNDIQSSLEKTDTRQNLKEYHEYVFN